jgi:hypothetical protein
VNKNNPSFETILLIIIAFLGIAIFCVVSTLFLQTSFSPKTEVVNLQPTITSIVFNKLPPTWTPKPTATVIRIATQTPLASATTIPIKPTKTSVSVSTQYVEINNQNYPEIYDPPSFITNPLHYKGKRFRITLYVLNIDNSGAEPVIFLGISRDQLISIPVAVFGLSGEQLKPGYKVTIYGIGVGEVSGQDIIGHNVSFPAIEGEGIFVVCTSKFGCK